MAEGFELYHIPQQSRRDKLRVVIENHHTSGCVGDLQGCAGLGLLPLNDQSSFISSSQNLLSCADIKSSLMGADDSNNCGNSASDYRPARTIMDTSINESLNRALFHGGDFVALSLSSQKTQNGTPPVELNLRSYGGGDCSRSAVVTPHGSDAGYGSILKGSKFLKPAQELLDEICDVGFGVYGDKFPVDCVMMIDSPPLENLRISVDDSSCGGVDKRKRSSLISLLDEVYKRYKQYYQQIKTVITSLETVSGFSNPAPFANLDIKAMSRHFHCLRNAITEQLQYSLKPREHYISYGKKEFMLSGSLDKGHYGQMGFVDHPLIWRPQRGLPKRAVTVLRSWLFDHFLHPYPTDTDKQSLAKQTGLSRNQVSNWFINARVRLWKPMVEEVHTLETRQAHGTKNQPMNQEPPSKRTRNDFPSDDTYNNQHIMEGFKEHMNLYDNLSIRTGKNRASVNRGLPLMLGLHQNNNIFTLSKSFPLNADGGSRRFVVGGLDPRNRQVGRDISGGRFVHDFGG